PRRVHCRTAGALPGADDQPAGSGSGEARTPRWLCVPLSIRSPGMQRRDGVCRAGATLLSVPQVHAGTGPAARAAHPVADWPRRSQRDTATRSLARSGAAGDSAVISGRWCRVSELRIKDPLRLLQLEEAKIAVSDLRPAQRFHMAVREGVVS